MLMQVASQNHEIYKLIYFTVFYLTPGGLFKYLQVMSFAHI